MIPADVASRLKLVVADQPAPPQSVVSAPKLADILSDLVPGQRILAEIQALLPNGTYRAVVAQRDVTLALPFSAKAGDSLELEVVESDGKLTLAFVANRTAAQPQAGQGRESVTTTLSSAGRLIGDLLGGIDQQGKRAPPAPLNGNQPLVAEFPDTPGQLIPVLKDALSRSGMFYESHQARWVEGKLPTSALLQEPQGKLSPRASAPPPPASAPIPAALPIRTEPPAVPQGRAAALQAAYGLAPETAPASPSAAAPTGIPAQPLSSTQTPSAAQLPAAAQMLPTSILPEESPVAGGTPNPALPEFPDLGATPSPDRGGNAAHPAETAEHSLLPPTGPGERAEGARNPALPAEREASPLPLPNADSTSAARPAASGQNPIPPDLTPLVQQQLDALATQNYVWQGQVWPGQHLHWEIEEKNGGPRPQDGEAPQQWQTRLKLTLPLLGGIEAVMHLRTGGEIDISLTADSAASREKLIAAGTGLGQQLESAGLRLTALAVQHGQAG